MKEIIFPTTAEKFIAYQDRLTTQPVSNGNYGIIAAYTELFNEVYCEAVEGKTGLLYVAVQVLKDAIVERPENEPLVHFERVAIAWIYKAFKQGRQDAQKAVRA